MKRIAILGAGGTGHTVAADLTLAGHDVVLYEEPEYAYKLDDVRDRGTIELTGALGEGLAKIPTTTTEIETALEDTEIILVAVSALRHEAIAKRCAPWLKDGQTILIGPDNGGALVFANIFKEMDLTAHVSIAGMASNYYPCRLIGPSKVVVGLPRSPKRIAAFPAKKTGMVIGKLSGLKGTYGFVPGNNVLEIALSVSNIPNHLAGSLLNTGAIEKSGGEYYLFKQGITPSVLACIKAVARERQALFDALGYVIGSNDLMDKIARQDEFPQLNTFRGLIGPTSMQHRYITEDAAVGQALMVSLADMVGVQVPVTRSLLTLASVINNTDYLKSGRTVERLGLSGLSIDALNKFLTEGYVGEHSCDH